MRKVLFGCVLTMVALLVSACSTRIAGTGASRGLATAPSFDWTVTSQPPPPQRPSRAVTPTARPKPTPSPKPAHGPKPSPSQEPNRRPKASPSPKAKPTLKPKPPAPHVVTLVDQAGDGIGQTTPFTATGDRFDIYYSYDCSAFGTAGNFIVAVEPGLNILVNDLKLSGSGIAHDYDDLGTPVHIEVNSECSWHISAKELVR